MKKQTKNIVPNGPISNSRWKSYTAAGAAVAAGTASAHAVIVNGITPATDLIDPTPDGDTSEAFTFQLLGMTDLLFLTNQDSVSSSNNFLATGPTTLEFVGFQDGLFAYPSNVPYGEVIGGLTFGVPSGTPRGDMAYGNGYSNSQFVDVGGYVAFRWTNFETGTYHGWAELSLISGTPENHFRLESYAYANASDNLSVGQRAPIPEPASMASLALGAIGLLSWRRSRRPE